MKQKITCFISGALATVLIIALTMSVYAAYQKQATLYYSDIHITLDGKVITPKDANGKVIEPFVIDGTTYLPIRGIASTLGLGVDWDQKTKTVILTSNGGTSMDKTLKNQLISTIWTISEEFDGDIACTSFIFNSDNSFYALWYIPYSGDLMAMMGTYTITGNSILMDYNYSIEEDGPVVEYTTSETNGIMSFTQVSEEGVYTHHRKGTVLHFTKGSELLITDDFMGLFNSVWESQ